MQITIYISEIEINWENKIKGTLQYLIYSKSSINSLATTPYNKEKSKNTIVDLYPVKYSPIKQDNDSIIIILLQNWKKKNIVYHKLVNTV